MPQFVICIIGDKIGDKMIPGPAESRLGPKPFYFPCVAYIKVQDILIVSQIHTLPN